jgi:hypothetical protein
VLFTSFTVKCRLSHFACRIISIGNDNPVKRKAVQAGNEKRNKTACYFTLRNGFSRVSFEKSLFGAAPCEFAQD